MYKHEIQNASGKKFSLKQNQSQYLQQIRLEIWYFVTKIVLTYCEKKMKSLPSLNFKKITLFSEVTLFFTSKISTSTSEVTLILRSLLFLTLTISTSASDLTLIFNLNNTYISLKGHPILTSFLFLTTTFCGQGSFTNYVYKRKGQALGQKFQPCTYSKTHKDKDLTQK